MIKAFLWSSLADNLEPHMKEAINRYKLEVIRTEDHFVAYTGVNGIDIRIKTGESNEYVELELNGEKFEDEIPMWLLSDFIIVNIQMD